MADPKDTPVEPDLEPHPADKARTITVADSLRRHHEHTALHRACMKTNEDALKRLGR